MQGPQKRRSHLESIFLLNLDGVLHKPWIDLVIGLAQLRELAHSEHINQINTLM